MASKTVTLTKNCTVHHTDRRARPRWLDCIGRAAMKAESDNLSDNDAKLMLQKAIDKIGCMTVTVHYKKQTVFSLYQIRNYLEHPDRSPVLNNHLIDFINSCPGLGPDINRNMSPEELDDKLRSGTSVPSYRNRVLPKLEPSTRRIMDWIITEYLGR